MFAGRRPDTTRVTDLIHYWRDVGGNYTTIPQYFKQNGYRTIGMGKIFHPGQASNNNDPISWTDPYFPSSGSNWGGETWAAVPDEKLVENPLIDMVTANHAVDVLKEVAPDAISGKQPFFVAVGFHKPHLPFEFPASFLKYYPEEEIHVPNNSFAPDHMPPIAWTDFDELRTFADIKYNYGYGNINTTLPDQKVRELRRAYYAALSYTDSLVGQVIQALEDLGLSDSTVISFWGDHGWQLGEHGEWCKHTNFEIATHAPMMLHIPGRTDHGIVTERLTEFVDLFPTLAEASGLPSVPLCPEDPFHVELCTEGVSVVPLIDQPERGWKTAAFSQFPRMNMSGITIMGYSIRTTRYRYNSLTQIFSLGAHF
jgi:iduronate 2-sulfatase